MVYDVSKEITLEGATKWIKDLEFDSGPNAVIMLVANKIDLTDQYYYLNYNPKRKVKSEDGKQIAE